MTVREMLRWVLAPLWAGLCYFGGESDSSQTSQMVDRRVSGGHGGAQISGDDNTVTVNAIDAGAVYAGLEATRGALAFADNSAKTTAVLTLGAFSAMDEQQRRTLDLVEDVYGKAVAETRGTLGTAVGAIGQAFETAKAGDQRIVSMVAMAVVGLAAVALLLGKAR